MTPQYHADDELLLGYVTGALSYPMEVAVAAHLTLCPRCRDAAADLERLGGAVLEELDGDPISESGLEQVLAQLDAPPAPAAAQAPEVDSAWARLVPAPLRDMAQAPEDALPWRKPLPGVATVDLASIAADGARARLVRTRAGGALPRHIHRGTELTLVLAGGLTDQHGHFRRGDLLVIPPGVTHRPVMDDDEDCLCFGVTDGKVVMTSVVGRLQQILGRY